MLDRFLSSRNEVGGYRRVVDMKEDKYKTIEDRTRIIISLERLRDSKILLIL